MSEEVEIGLLKCVLDMEGKLVEQNEMLVIKDFKKLVYVLENFPYFVKVVI